jgi:hypothetical protein
VGITLLYCRFWVFLGRIIDINPLDTVVYIESDNKLYVAASEAEAQASNENENHFQYQLFVTFFVMIGL